MCETARAAKEALFHDGAKRPIANRRRLTRIVLVVQFHCAIPLPIVRGIV
jgi:hypothetical protein